MNKKLKKTIIATKVLSTIVILLAACVLYISIGCKDKISFIIGGATLIYGVIAFTIGSMYSYEIRVYAEENK